MGTKTYKDIPTTPLGILTDADKLPEKGKFGDIWLVGEEDPYTAFWWDFLGRVWVEV
jgi:hypothetical protein